MPDGSEFQVDIQRILKKVQDDPVGLRIVNSAVQQCIIEDQQQQIQELKEALLSKQNGPAEGESGGEA